VVQQIINGELNGTNEAAFQLRMTMLDKEGELLIYTSITEWRNKSFVQRHRMWRDNGAGAGADLIMECDEVRIFAARREGETTAIRALPIPEAIRKLCE
jgi:4-hydroxybenzoyl-CoA thioesterase